MNPNIPEGVSNYAFALLVNQKKNFDEIKNILLEKGVDEKECDAVINNIQEKIIRSKKEKAKHDITYGGIILSAGLALTAVTYLLGDGVYIIAWGAILFGAIRLIRGVINS